MKVKKCAKSGQMTAIVPRLLLAGDDSSTSEPGLLHNVMDPVSGAKYDL